MSDQYTVDGSHFQIVANQDVYVFVFFILLPRIFGSLNSPETYACSRLGVTFHTEGGCVLSLPRSSAVQCNLDYFKLCFPVVITVKDGKGICYGSVKISYRKDCEGSLTFYLCFAKIVFLWGVKK